MTLGLVLVAVIGCGESSGTNGDGCGTPPVPHTMYVGSACVLFCTGSDGGYVYSELCRPDGAAPYCIDGTRDLNNCGGCGRACTCTTAGLVPRCTSSRCDCVVPNP